MWKIIAPTLALALVLFSGTAQAAERQAPAGGQRGNTAAPASGGETKAIVVGGLAFVLMVGTAGAVLWHTARRRRPVE